MGHARFSFEGGEEAGDMASQLLQCFFFLFREDDYEFIAAESAAESIFTGGFPNDGSLPLQAGGYRIL